MLGLLVVERVESVGCEHLGEGVLQYGAPVDVKLSLEYLERHAVAEHGDEESRVAQKQLEDAVLAVEAQRCHELGHVVTGDRHAGVGQPDEVALVALAACRLCEVGELEALVLLAELSRDSVEDSADVGLVAGVLHDVGPVQL